MTTRKSSTVSILAHLFETSSSLACDKPQKSTNLTDGISTKDNFSNLQKVFSTGGLPAHEYIYGYCYDYDKQCDPGTVAYSWSSMYIFWRNHYTVFCPILESIQTLEDSIRNAGDSSHKQRIMENFEINRGQIMLHEVYHYTGKRSSSRSFWRQSTQEHYIAKVDTDRSEYS